MREDAGEHIELITDTRGYGEGVIHLAMRFEFSEDLRFESNIQSRSGIISDICLAMFHLSGLRRDWNAILVDIHCTNPETRFRIIRTRILA